MKNLMEMKKLEYLSPDVQVLHVQIENPLMEVSATGNIDDWEYDDDELDF